MDYDSEEQDLETKIPFFKRDKGPKYPELFVITLSDALFDRLINNWYNRLMCWLLCRDVNVIKDATTRFNSLQMILGDFKFSGQDPILLFDFLAMLTEAADMNQLTDAQAYIATSRFLRRETGQQFWATRNISRSGGITRWPEEVQYFLKTYATPSAIQEVVEATSTVKHKTKKTELQYRLRINNDVYRCANM